MSEEGAELRLLYQNAVGNIEFCKKQQWWITNQTLAVYVALFLIDKSLPGWELLTDIGLVIFALVAACISTWLVNANHESACLTSAPLGQIEVIA